MTELPRALDQDHSRIETQPEEHGHEQRKFPTKQALPFYPGGNRNHDRAGDDGRGCCPCSPGLDPGSRNLDAVRRRGGIYTETQNRGSNYRTPNLRKSRCYLAIERVDERVDEASLSVQGLLLTDLKHAFWSNQRALNCCSSIDGPRRGQVGARRETIVAGWHPWPFGSRTRSILLPWALRVRKDQESVFSFAGPAATPQVETFLQAALGGEVTRGHA